MSVAKVIELISSSKTSIEDAVNDGIRRAGESVDHIEGVWVQDVKGVVEGGKVSEWRTTLKITFVVND